MPKILVVDDVEANRYVMSKILTREGLEVATAENGTSALERASREPFDLILLDVNMPDMDGFEVCRRLKEDPKSEIIPVIIVSGTYQDIENRVHGIELGAIDYLTEPVNREELIARVKSVLRYKYYFDRSERDARRFRGLAEIGNLLFGSFTSLRLPPEIAAKIMEIFCADGTAILYRDRPGEPIRSALSGGILSDLFEGRDIEPEKAEGLLIRAFDKKSIITLSREEALIDPLLGRGLREKPPHNLLIAPLTYKQQSKGILLLARREATLQPEEHASLEVLTSRLTASFLNREAYEYLHRINDLTTLRNIKLQEEIATSHTHLSYTSHDLKTPLNAIMGYAAMLQAGMLDEKKKRTAVERIQANSKDLLQMIENMLNQSKEYQAERVEVDLEALIRSQAENQLIPLLFGKEVEIQKRIEPGLKMSAAEPSYIKHILSNLFSNAAKFTPFGSIRISAKRAKERGRDGVEIRVSDTGIGIDPERLPKIFERFNHEPGYEGSGLGLSIVHDIVHRMGGNIKVKSERGEGTQFTVWLPLQTS